jgi:ClpP class serine protease
MTTKEKTLAQNSVNELYTVFVNHVTKSRRISDSVIRNDIGAFIYDNLGATKNNLIDGTRSLSELFDQISIDLGIYPDHLGVLILDQQ